MTFVGFILFVLFIVGLVGFIGPIYAGIFKEAFSKRNDSKRKKH